MHLSQTTLARLWLATLLFTTFIAYQPGLSGPFLFDDFPNLRDLRQVTASDDQGALLSFALAGDAGPLGRPVSLLSFALQASSWPSNPYPFKLANLTLHLATALLVTWLVFRLARVLWNGHRDSVWIALLTGTLWALHPMNVSTTLYVIQRMTQMAALFTLAGLIGYTHGREMLDRAPQRGFLWMSLSIALAGIVATLSKESGILLCVYALTIEFTIFRPSKHTSPPHHDSWCWLFLAAPLLLLVTYFTLQWSNISSGYVIRPFTVMERLLTESRVLLDYLREIYFPRSGGSGLFHDDYSISTNLASPPTTLLSLIAITTLLLTAWRFRRKYPLYSFAVLWYFGGHLLESTALPLELYFEHRNYVPMIGPLMLFSGMAISATRKYGGYIKYGVAAYALLFAITTFQSTQTWGDDRRLAQISVVDHPRSVRARQLAAGVAAREKDYDSAKRQIGFAVRYNPEEPTVVLESIKFACLDGTLKQPQIQSAIAVMPHAAYSAGVGEPLLKLIRLAQSSACKKLTLGDVQAMLSGLLKNKKFTFSKKNTANLYFIEAQIHIAQRHLNQALRSVDQSYHAMPNIHILLFKSAVLRSAGLYDQALETLDQAKKLDQNSGILTRGMASHGIATAEQALLRERTKTGN